MGSWNGTCGMSQLPIHSGDKVKLILLKKHPFTKSSMIGNGFCNSDDLFRPLYIPLEGTYNSYGSIEDIKDPNSQHLMFLFKKLDEDVEYSSLEEIVNDASTGSIEDISFVLIHNDLYYKSIDLVKNKIINWEGKSSTLEEFLKAFINRFISLNTKKEIFDSFYINKLPIMLRNNYFKNVIEFPEQKDFVEFLLFQDCLETGRKFWSPQSSAGSQDSNYEVSKMIGQYSIDKEKEYLDYINN